MNPAITGDMTFMSASATPDQIERFRLMVGDTVITKDSETADDIGIPAFVEYEAPDLICGYHLAIVRPERQSMHPRYLYWTLSSAPTLRQWAVLASGVTRVGIRSTDLKKASIPLPSLVEQVAIADFLDRETAQIDTLIGMQEQLIARLRERRTSVIASTLDSVGFAHMTRLKRVATIQTGITLNGEGNSTEPEWQYLRVAYVQLDHVTTLRLPAGEARQSLLRSGDVLMTEGGDIDKLGRGALWEGQIENMLHQNHIFAVRPSTHLSSKFLVYWLDGPTARQYFRSTARKTTNLASTNKWTLGNLPVSCPELAQQHRMVAGLDERLAKIDILVAEATEFIALVKERRNALITAAVTGQIDVSKAA